MSRVIVFCGLPASGKTTLSQEVSKKLNMFCLHKDALKERMYTLLEGNSLEDSKLYGRCVIEMILSLAEDSIKNGIDIILESPFNHPDNPRRFQEWLEKYSIDFHVVICSVDEEERKRRHESRVRHPGHHDQERLNLYPFNPGTFDYAEMPGKKLFLETSKSQEELVEKVMTFLRS